MGEWEAVGKLLIVAGCAVVVVGVLLVLGERVSGLSAWLGWVGKLPGDISITRDRFSFYIPLGTSLVLSIGLSLLFYLVSWLFRR